MKKKNLYLAFVDLENAFNRKLLKELLGIGFKEVRFRRMVGRVCTVNT